MDPLPTEIEAKLRIPREKDLRAIARLERLGRYTLHARGTLHLQSFYLDTADLALASHGVALRLRRSGRRWEATAKWIGTSDGALHLRPELNVPLAQPPRFPFRLPDGPLRLQLCAQIAGRALRPILVTQIRRTLFDVLAATSESQPNGSNPIAELALDRVRLAAPPPTSTQRGSLAGSRAVDTYSEAEIELKHGGLDDVEALAHLLQTRFGLTPSADSKFERGLTLLYGNRVAAAMRPSLPSADDSLAAGVRKLLALHLARLRRNDPGTRLGHDPEALHDMRVAVRRLRAVLRLFRATIPARSRDAIEGELSWLGGCLGNVRDLDVQIGRLSGPGTATALDSQQRAASGTLRQHLRRQRDQRRTEMIAALESRRYFRLLVRLERLTVARRPPQTATRPAFARAGLDALRRASKRLLKAGHQIDEVTAEPTPEDLHDLRIRAKRLRYLLEFLREITGKPGRRLTRRLIRLQDLLGAHQDAVVAAEFVRRYVDEKGNDVTPEELLALGALIAREQRLAAKARAGFHKAWRRFDRKRTSGDLRASEERLRAAAGGARQQTGANGAAGARA
jgi:inorganic triphosphatase YgiF